ncbi:unnamed protein product (macronuclear) [Paramecium tetraurelia]|uniref:SecA DEAD-like N-terminal domain-containing protein n=1 Tax=Paramecium tetraurelia TaxID=5888 RepID=A0CGC4_PARTE|nr:uncharacterized protein GSPATT00007281001 [Paramecium tetraurelia]CAK69841.1 unnamed protein product [Paramecium tetraurelia]|eukprot:XP_001437238.1 hypothetical protein (macronuclear) [Paramecium tetraurelia strain d4-2]
MQQNFLPKEQNKVLTQIEQINFVKNLTKEKKINEKDSQSIIEYIEKNQHLSPIIQHAFGFDFYNNAEFLQLIYMDDDYITYLNKLESLKTSKNENSINQIKKTILHLLQDQQFNETQNFSSSSSIELEDTILLWNLVKKQFQQVLQPSQLLVVLELYEHGSKGRIAEISPGEGKTLITALLAILLVKKKLKNVYIIIGSNSLAIQKSKELTQFYNLCNVSVSYNINDQIGHSEQMSSSYQNQVIYGDVLSHQKSNKYGVQGYIILNDEIDSLFPVGTSTDSYIQIKTKFQQNILFYQERLLGLTGFLGSEEQSFLAKKYNLDCVQISAHSQNPIDELQGITMKSEHEWFNNIINAVQEQKQNNKAVLIIAQSEGEMNKIYREISRSQKIIKYTENDKISKIEIEPYSTNIATYQLILLIITKINAQLEQNGGIHVIMSFLPQSSRLKELGFARIFRQGIKGSKQMIVQMKESQKCNSIGNNSQLHISEREQENSDCLNLENLKLLTKQNEQCIYEIEKDLKEQGDCQMNQAQDEKQKKLLQQSIMNQQQNLIAQKLNNFYKNDESYQQEITQDSIQYYGFIKNLPVETNENRFVASSVLPALSNIQHIVLDDRKMYMTEKQQQILCLKHNVEATYVFCDEQLKGQEKLGCDQCLNEMDKICCEKLEFRKEQIFKRKMKARDQIQGLMSYYLDDFNSMIENLKKESKNLQSFLEQFQLNVCKFEERIKNQIEQLNYFSLLKEIDYMNATENFLIENEKKEMQEQIALFVKQFQMKLKQEQQQFQNLIQKFNDSLDIPPKYQEINHKLLYEFEQQELCQVLTFNFDNSKIIAGQGQNLKVWDFQQDKMIDNKIVLKGHEQNIRSIIISKKRNYLVSESDDSFLICWNLSDDNQGWQQKLTKKLNSSKITYLIMNEAEDQLICCSSTGKIGIYKIIQQENIVEEIQNLLKHNKQVNCASLSKSHDTMVSCDEDDQIIIWTKNQRGLWNFTQSIDASGSRILSAFFQSNDKIITFTSNGKIEEFIKKNNENFYSHNLRSDINSHQKICNSPYELVYNEMRQLFIIKNPQKIFFITQFSLQLQNIPKNSINCNENTKVFNISKNGKYLVTWIGQPNPKFKVYEIQYDQ